MSTIVSSYNILVDIIRTLMNRWVQLFIYGSTNCRVCLPHCDQRFLVIRFI